MFNHLLLIEYKTTFVLIQLRLMEPLRLSSSPNAFVVICKARNVVIFIDFFFKPLNLDSRFARSV